VAKNKSKNWGYIRLFYLFAFLSAFIIACIVFIIVIPNQNQLIIQEKKNFNIKYDELTKLF